MSAEQFLAGFEGKRCELVRGEVVGVSPASRRHSLTTVRLIALLQAAVERTGHGEVHTELGFRLGRDPDIVRAPDVAVVSADRLAGVQSQGWFEGAPDLAVEVLSPGDRASEVIARVQEYLRAGTKLVAILDPQSETVVVHHPGGESHSFTGASAASLERVLPGFALRPAELFRSAR